MSDPNQHNPYHTPSGEAHPTAIMSVCSICDGAEYVDESAPTPNLVSFPCCELPICIYCLGPVLTTTTQASLFRDLPFHKWLICPIPNCGGVLDVATVEELCGFFERVGMNRDVDTHVEVFARALARRAEIRRVAAHLVCQTAEKVVALHMKLHDAGVARHILSEGHHEAILTQVYFGPEIIAVPVFTTLFHREAARTCAVCAEEHANAPAHLLQAWNGLADLFRGSLHYLTEPFPRAGTVPACAAAHAEDVCKLCIERHIRAQLDSRGPRAVGDIACPAGCGHVYTSADIRALAAPQTTVEYERLGVVGLIAKEDSFRWCLRAGCINGANYDTSPGCCEGATLSADMARALGPDARLPHRIVCDACNFAMCLACQAPWHQGLTCEEYKAQADGADASGAWVRQNTKRCPREDCGVMVEKGNLCFHMTCTECCAEWCWECQADWREIFPQGGAYNMNAHKEGCFFRAERAPHPMFMQGATLEEAVARNELPEDERGVMQGGLG